ncbi:carboxypeptidase-like regulatory domain-containing protein [uncultured Acetobacteroides sp.]|uniref:carboxypeptidase-like regulatory domain-containing protein n=1 Tax=uncultured Acetobacteroides sp. TaxID=1760811 RepID=UPI0029F54CF1|nr:carboxypeptidase-like regulatory domain-containing protein [uncultured Acetobacteroides sp.]
MNTKQERKLAMALTLLDFFNKNISVANAIPNFPAIFLLLQENVKQIQLNKGKQEANITGLFDIKEQLRKELVVNTCDVVRKLKACAVMSGNKVLEKEVSYNETDFSRSREASIPAKVQVVCNRANEHLKDLAVYGVTEKALSDLKQLSDNFLAAIPTVRTSITDMKVITAQLDALFVENDNIMGKLDVLVDVVRLTQPSFYSAYRNNRKIVNKGGTTLALKGHVVDAKSGEAIKGVKVTFTPKGVIGAEASAKGKKVLVKKTADKGAFFVKNLSEGIYVVTIEKVGYVTQTVEISVDGSEMAKLLVKLDKV